MKRTVTFIWIPVLLILCANNRVYSLDINANSCSSSDVQAAVDSATNGDRVVIPAGYCKWTSKVSTSKSIDLEGAGIDQTTIDCGTLDRCFEVTGSAGQWQVSQFTWTGGLNTGFAYCLVCVGTTGRDWRIHNNKFYNWNRNQAIGVFLQGSYGLIDHNIFSAVTDKYLRIGIRGQAQTSGDKGFSAWQKPYMWGTGDAIFIEDNKFIFSGFGTPIDGEAGARFVFRYNDITNGTVTWHGNESRYRGAIGGEIYNNKWATDKAGLYRISRAHSTRSGISAFHDNWIQGYETPMYSNTYRASASWFSIEKNGQRACDGKPRGMCSQDYRWDCINDSDCTGKYCTLYSGDSKIPCVTDADCSAVGAGSCSDRGSGSCLRFCSNNKDIRCATSSDCGGAACGFHYDPLPGELWTDDYACRDDIGIGPGGQVVQPQMAWGNLFCKDSGDANYKCTPVPVTAGVISGRDTAQENRNFFNCESQADCEAKTGRKYTTYPYPHPLAGSKISPPKSFHVVQ